MHVRALSLLVVLASTPATADTFGGFSGVDKPYLVNADRICRPLRVENGSATGAPDCAKQPADVIARLSIKAPIPVSGPKAAFHATADGRTLTVTAGGNPVVTWKTMDPILRVVEVYTSQYNDRVAVAYSVRAMGKEQTVIVGFDLLKPGTPVTAKDPNTPKDPNAPKDPNDPNAPKDPNTGVAPEDPKIAKAADAARKAPKGKQVAAWEAVLALDAAHSESMFQLAKIHATDKKPTEAQQQLDKLAASRRADAIEWLIEARFDAAFAALRANPKFRTAVGLDRKPASVYERLMVFGGGWEQSGTSCDKAEVRLKLKRERTFKLNVKTNCHGSIMDLPFSGKWRASANGVVLILPNKGKATAADEAPCRFEPVGDEDSLHCDLGKGIDFVVLPSRR